MNQTFYYGSYSGFKETVDTLTERLTLLMQYCDSLGLERTSKSIAATIEKVAQEHFEVAIVGEFKRGKSTLINAMLGQEVLHSDVLPATATLNRVTYSESPYVT
ncbi:MAG: dynamin family protein, partial [Oscillospiraceae bacterium]|nr:dynamin family protein [Oscillospiraceae bacterium]